MKPVFPGAPGKLGEPLPCIVEGGNRPNVHLAAIANTQKEANRLVDQIILKCKELVSEVGVYADELEGLINFDYWMNSGDDFIDKHLGWLDALDFIYLRGGSKPVNIEDFRQMKQQTESAGVRFGIEQLGANVFALDSINPEGPHHWLNLKDPNGADPSEWPEDLK